MDAVAAGGAGRISCRFGAVALGNRRAGHTLMLEDDDSGLPRMACKGCDGGTLLRKGRSVDTLERNAGIAELVCRKA